VKADPKLQNGFNAVGFSQGSQFLRAYVERCNDPPVYNLITMGGQHMGSQRFHYILILKGVADVPNCLTVNETICRLVQDLLAFGAYTGFVQDHVVN
jgi:palmitoyl-protein thioesterase